MADVRRDGSIAVHDYSGHPFQVQLSRELARRGHQVTHYHCPSFSTPKGNLEVTDGDPVGLAIEAVRLRRPFAKYSGLKRFVQEIEYGWRLGRRLRRARPSVVLSSNTPLLAAGVLQTILLLSRIPVVFWQQDVYSVAMANHARTRLPRLGPVVAAVLTWVERTLLTSSRQVVTISADFLDILESWGVDRDRVHVVENWAPLDELPVRPRANPWSTAHGLDGKTVFLYSGTLGLKHDPSLLVALAESFADRDDACVVVASEGLGAEWLRTNAAHLPSLRLLGFQPYEDLPDMMGTADVLVALLESGASCFSVPSKVLTYHCAGRAILAALPEENLAARIIEHEGSGLVVSPDGHEAFVAAARKLVENDDLCRTMGLAARDYALRTFDIGTIAGRFEEIIGRARTSR
jgi:glycosyltransferase involved in cell wall biosynthesis